ncbi:hypothetical protein B7P34_36300 [Streptosporangium nondiastaticum]|uniref:Uncharacterized protein n=1 Tax=Streptosporangium nondiastaticum TaxID=35764 RepID=A0A9X7JHM8_9ACTN|nr:hypothetical protein B7P34_36300 [Streptosporangium nondiastaticum]
MEVDRAILEEHKLIPGRSVIHLGRTIGDPEATHGCQICDDWDGLIVASGGCRTLLLVASRYRHHAGYLEAWRPTP